MPLRGNLQLAYQYQVPNKCGHETNTVYHKRLVASQLSEFTQKRLPEKNTQEVPVLKIWYDATFWSTFYFGSISYKQLYKQIPIRIVHSKLKELRSLAEIWQSKEHKMNIY